MKTFGSLLLFSLSVPALSFAQSPPAPASGVTQASAAPVAPAHPDAQPAAPGGYQSPVYPQPVWTEPTLVRRSGPRRVIPYRGGPIPMGMHVETRRLHGLVVGGAIVFGVSYLGGALTTAACSGLITASCAPGTGWLLVPAAGPFVALGFAQSGESRALLVADGVLQLAGLAMLTGAFLTTRTFLVDDRYAARTHRPQWSLVPAGPAGSTGATFTLTSF